MNRCKWLRAAVSWICLAPLIATAQPQQIAENNRLSTERLQGQFFSDFDLGASAAHADEILTRQPGSFVALFIRMETAALQQRTDAVLDSALRLCTMPAPPEMQEIASSRILENAGNSRAFDEVLRRVGLAMEESNACTFNLRLALVAAAADGSPRLDLDKTAQSAGLLTRWRIAGPFGRFSNVDFDQQWAPDADQFWTVWDDAGESFWFRDGMVALPDYFSGTGVFYASSEVQTGPQGILRLDMLSPGPYTIYIDGKEKLTKDSRFASSGNRQSLALHLNPGRHRIMVKFTADALPFSVDLHREFVRKSGANFAFEPPLEEYVRALLEYFRGNLSAVERTLATRDDARGPFLYLRALLWSAAEERSPRARAAWEALGKSQSSALLARIKAAEFAIEDRPTTELRTEIADLERQRPDSEAAAQLAFHATHADSRASTPALSHLLELHPTCSRILEALKAYTSAGDQAAAQAAETRLSHCAPESLDYARVLSEAGRHNEAATLLQQKLAHNHLDRAAQRMLVQELVLSGELEEAREQAQELHKIAPRSSAFAHLAADPTTVLDSRSERANGFVSRSEFYSAYRRSGVDVARSTAQQSFSGSTTALLLYDRVLKIRSDGTASLYSHRVVRLQDMQAISRYGEVALPRGGDLLELRTIKPSGQVIEPELVQQKPTISMPALEPGDAIEEEFVAEYPDWRRIPRSASLFEFASFLAPIVSSRFVLITPKTGDIQVELRNGAPPPSVDANPNEVVRIWQVAEMPALAAEPFAPEGNLVPAVYVAPADNALDDLRDVSIDSIRVGPHAIEAVAAQNFSQAISEREKARRLYRFVTSRIESTGPDLATSTAEDALVAGEGSRTAVLLALAHAAGLKAELLMARKIDHLGAESETLECYTEPLVRFWLGGEVIDADAEADDLPFGAVPAELDPAMALLIRLKVPSPNNHGAIPERTALSVRPSQEKSVADGDLFLDRSGNLTASIRVRLGITRAQEVRSRLRSGSDAERQNYFEQLAARVFSGAIDVRGAASHLDDPEQPLELTLTCRVPHFITAQPGLKETSQLAPLLGLRSFVTGSTKRRFPLLLDSVLFESTTFHLHLPAGIAVDSVPHDYSSGTRFGEYTVRFARQQKQLDIMREFEVPVQVVEPEHFAAFVQFARGIDEAELQPIVLDVRGTNAETRSTASQSGTANDSARTAPGQP